MNATVFALTGYIVWIMVLLGGLAVYRSALTVSGKRAANAFNPDGKDVSAFSGRPCLDYLLGEVQYSQVGV